MRGLAELLAEAVTKYFELIKNTAGDSRIVIPAPTWEFAKKLRAELLVQGIKNAYLVADEGITPSEAELVLRPNGLTALRIGSFVAVCTPGSLSKLQDSIRGSGGTIRSIPFGEEWPWVETKGLEDFAWERLLTVWAQQASDREDQRKWVVEFVHRAFVVGVSATTRRAEILFDNALARVVKSDKRGADFENEMLFGMSLPGTGMAESQPAKGLVPRLEKLGASLLALYAEQGWRASLLVDVQEMVPEPAKQDLIKRALEKVLDEIALIPPEGNGIATLFGAWSRARLTAQEWKELNLVFLEKLLGLQNTGKVRFVLSSLSTNDGIADPGSAVCCVRDGGVLRGQLSYDKGAVRGDVRIFAEAKAGSRFKPLQEPDKRLSANTGTVEFEIGTESLVQMNCDISKPVQLRFMLEDENSNLIRKIGASLHVVSSTRPAVIVFPALGEVIDLESDNEIPVLDGTESLTALLVLHSKGLNPAVEINGQDVSFEGELVRRSSCPISVERYSTDGSATVTVKLDDGNAFDICQIEAQASEDGAFTVEAELGNRAAAGGKKLEQILKFYRAEDPTIVLNLESISERSRIRSVIAREYLESRDVNPGPILIESTAPATIPQPKKGAWIHSFSKLDLDSRVNKEFLENAIRDYKAVRKELQDAIAKTRATASARPIYADSPVFTSLNSAEVEEKLVRYLDIWAAMQDLLSEDAKEQNWETRFAISSLDTVVLYGEQQADGIFLSPWHPLVLSKRYLNEKNLFSVAQRIANDGLKIPVNLLKLGCGFNWLHRLERDDKNKFSNALVYPTSDSGWYFAVPAIGSLERFAATRLERVAGSVLGLDVSLIPSASEFKSEQYLENYNRAYPARRFLRLKYPDAARADSVVNGVSDFLSREQFQGEDRYARFPGGIHLHFDTAISDLAKHAELGNSIFVYESTSIDGADNKAFDIEVLPPITRIRFERETSAAVAYGSGDASIYSLPSYRVIVGGGGKPTSEIVLGRCGSNYIPVGELNRAFIGATRVIERLVGYGTKLVLDVDLPEKLKSLWMILPGVRIDPAVIIEYVKAGLEEQDERALWDYSWDLERQVDTYFTLSRVPPDFKSAVNGTPFFKGEDRAASVLKKLCDIGVAVGTDVLRTGRNANGVLGLSAGASIFNDLGAFRSGENTAGFLIPVDSFRGLLGKASLVKRENDRRSDLLAVQIAFDEKGSKALISYSAIECKYTSGLFTTFEKDIEQANNTSEVFKNYIDRAIAQDGIAERLALASLIQVGMRMSRCTSKSTFSDLEQRVLSAILSGSIELVPSKKCAVLVSSECSYDKAELRYLAKGAWIRLAPGHWPGDKSEDLEKVGRILVDWFRPILDKVGFADRALGTVQTGIGAPELATVAGEKQPSPMRVEEQAPELARPVVIEGRSEEVRSNATNSEGQPVEDVKNDVVAQDVTVTSSGILIGVSGSNYITYNPFKVEDRLDNYNVMITGSSGKGKTQLIKYLLAKLSAGGVRSMILDFKSDFSTAEDEAFRRDAKLGCSYVREDGIPFNPLIPPVSFSRKTGEGIMFISEHVTAIAAMFRDTFGLGPQQEMSVKNAIRAALAQNGITANKISAKNLPDFPDFNLVGDLLRNDNPGAANRMAPLFDLDLFPSEFASRRFDQMLAESLILDVSQVPDTVKNAIARMVVVSAHGYFNARSHSSRLTQCFVFDEAHRILGLPYMETFARECRAYGVGLLLSSQYPTDFSANISGALATKVIHGIDTSDEGVERVSRALGLADDDERVGRLGMFEAIINNRDYRNDVMKTITYPHWCLLRSIKDAGGFVPVAQLDQVAGVRSELLGSVIKHLQDAGLLRRDGDRVHLLYEGN